ncbi:rab escort protein 1 [Silene latifolia]|uniref:rab escort protein 1 n=1 Tax=Silene latifolia TaxID=37657 RepID=UPI003D78AA87
MSNPSQPEYPPIDPTNFDLILIGTSLPSSILAAASASVSKTILHVDPNPFYGSHFSTLSPSHLSPYLSPPPPLPPSLSTDYSAVPLSHRHLTTAISIPPLPPHLPHNLALDVSGPRVLFCADAAIQLLLTSQVSHYLEFKAVDQNLIYDGDKSCFLNVPDSKFAIFKDKAFTLPEKNKLGMFFKRVNAHLTGDADLCISDDDLDTPFFEFLSNFGLPKRIIGIILYAIALADYDQENVEASNNLLKTRDGINRLALYHSSVGRFPNAHGAMLYPMYGQGELPQAFCRRAAVKGSIYVLRMPVAALLTDKDTGLYKGVRLASGQDIFSQKLIMDPDLAVPHGLALSTPENSEKNSNHSCSRDLEKKVARAICITKTSLKSDSLNLLIVLPPRSLYNEQATSVRALQMSGNSAVCPVGMFVVHLSTLCNDANQGERLLTAAIDVLFRQPTSGSADDDPAEGPSKTSDDTSSVQEEQRPVLEWRALYIQDITEESVHTISTTPSPDGNLGYNDLFDATERMFQQMYPGEVFFPEQAAPKDEEHDEDVDPE